MIASTSRNPRRTPSPGDIASSSRAPPVPHVPLIVAIANAVGRN